MTAVPPSPSGLSAVDRQWGGFASGSSYLLVGRAGAGRSALALQTVRAAVDDGQRCLVLSPRSPEALVEIGRGIGLDLAAAHGAGTLRLLRIPSADRLAARGPEKLVASYHDLARMVASDRPHRVVIEDFTPLVQFDTFERFHHAFSELVEAFQAQGTTLVIGLGDPANDASRRLLDVVEDLVDGTIRLDWSGDVALGEPVRAEYPSSDGASVDAEPPTAPSDDVLPAQPEPTPEPIGVMAEAPSEPAPSAEPEPTWAAPSEPEAEAGFETTFSVSAPSESADAEAAPEPPPAVDAPPATDATLAAPTSDPARQPDTDLDSPPATEIVPPPAPELSLLQPDTDAFGHDPSDALFEQGFLADSGICRVAEPALVPSAPVPAMSRASAPPSFTPPSFAPLGAPPAPAPDATFRTTLDDSFAARAHTPFVVVAMRAEPGTPAADHFGAIEAGFRASLRPSDRLQVDAERTRLAAVLPASGPEAGQALSDGLQAHLRDALGEAAEGVLQTVAAVTLPDGQPFQTPAELLAYAIDG